MDESGAPDGLGMCTCSCMSAIHRRKAVGTLYRRGSRPLQPSRPTALGRLFSVHRVRVLLRTERKSLMIEKHVDWPDPIDFVKNYKKWPYSLDEVSGLYGSIYSWTLRKFRFPFFEDVAMILKRDRSLEVTLFDTSEYEYVHKLLQAHEKAVGVTDTLTVYDYGFPG